MRRGTWLVAVLGSGLILSGAAAAQQPGVAAPQPEQLPLPRAVPIEVLPGQALPPAVAPVAAPIYPGYHRVSAYAVWGGYAPSVTGIWAPRVIYPPGGHAYYPASGQAYPLGALHPWTWNPFYSSPGNGGW
jgi:hypothetical protein